VTRGSELDALEAAVRRDLESANAGRETALAACRRTIQACGNSIRAVHRGEAARAAALAEAAAAALGQAHEALRPFPQLAAAGPLHDAEKEYAEARLTAAMVADAALPSYRELDVSAAAWLCGLAEAASELRRHLLDRLRAGDMARGDDLLALMSDVYDMLVSIDYPDAVTGGLRRATDALRAVLERTRGDVTTSLLQSRLQAAIESRLPPEASPGPAGS